MQDKIGHWTAYRAFNEHALDELARGELDDWFAVTLDDSTRTEMLRSRRPRADRARGRRRRLERRAELADRGIPLRAHVLRRGGGALGPRRLDTD